MPEANVRERRIRALPPRSQLRRVAEPYVAPHVLRCAAPGLAVAPSRAGIVLPPRPSLAQPGLAQPSLSQPGAHVAPHPRRDRYRRMVSALVSVCMAKGWRVDLEREDVGFQFATIGLSKTFDDRKVTATLDAIVKDDAVKYSIQKTSEHGYGLKTLLEAIEVRFHGLGWREAGPRKEAAAASPSEIILRAVLGNFDKIARQLGRRREGRAPYVVADEYDVQDLLHAILRAFFDDVRKEECAPSHAGAASRIDFLLFDAKTAVEVKFVHETTQMRRLREEILVDQAQYAAHPCCGALYVLVYDPNRRLANPGGLETDLSGAAGGLSTTLLVTPK